MGGNRGADSSGAHNANSHIGQFSASQTGLGKILSHASKHDGLDVPQHHQHHHNGIIRYAGRGVGHVPYADVQRFGIIGIHMLHPHAAGNAQAHAVFMIDIPQLWGNYRFGQDVNAVGTLGLVCVFGLGSL